MACRASETWAIKGQLYSSQRDSSMEGTDTAQKNTESLVDYKRRVHKLFETANIKIFLRFRNVARRDASALKIANLFRPRS